MKCRGPAACLVSILIYLFVALKKNRDLINVAEWGTDPKTFIPFPKEFPSDCGQRLLFVIPLF